jgi:hypothetical protein
MEREFTPEQIANTQAAARTWKIKWIDSEPHSQSRASIAEGIING